MNPGLNLKAEAALAVQLIARHRAPQLAAVVLTAAVIVTAKWAVPASSGGVSPVATLLAAAAAQGAIIGSRLGTPAALATARAAGAVTFAMVAGRLAGTAVLLLPIQFVQVAAVVPLNRAGTFLLISMMWTLSAAVVAMVVARWFGSTAAAFLVATVAIIGAVPALTHGVSGNARSQFNSVLVIGVGFIAVTAGAVFLLRERPLRLKKPTPSPRTRRWGRYARR